MNATDPKVAAKIACLQKQVKAAKQEFDMAVTFHETWKPAAYDEDLQKRMGVSLATNAFLVVRSALRREMLLALLRLWDKDSRTVRMKESIPDTLRTQSVINALAADRAARRGMADWEDEMRDDLSQRASEAIALVEKYSRGGAHCTVLENLRRLRHERLAHRQIDAMPVTTADATDAEIESFYQDNSQLIHLLESLVEAVAYDPNDHAEAYRPCAELFWAGVRGERTEGHPNYRAPF
jgi:AbiU2